MLKIHSTEVVADGNIVPAEDYQACISAEGIVKAAHDEARLIIRKANEDSDRLKQRGFEEGLAEGRMEISQHILESVSKYVEYLSAMEGRIVEIVTKALRKILGEIDERQLIVRVIGQALSVARDQAKLKLRVGPSDVETVRSKLDELMKPYPAIQFIDVVCDTRMSSGGCVLESAVGVVDASVETQIAAIEKSLSKSLGAK